ncbi:MAG: ATP-binding protein [Streptosporangiaceae bacterium]
MARPTFQPGARSGDRPRGQPAARLTGRRRRWVRPGGLRRRLVVAFVLVAAISAGALAISSFLLVRQARLQGSLNARAVEARQDLRLAALIRYRVASEFVRAYERPGAHAVLIFPRRRSVPSNPQVNPAIPASLRGIVGQGKLGYERIEISGHPFLVLGGKVSGSPARLYLLFDESAIQGNLSQLRNTLAIAWLGVVLLAALIGNALARRTLEPVARASDAARLMAGGRLETRLPAGPPDEFGAWAAAFNEMADALEVKIAELVAAQDRERRFTANVAHELRTPLAALVAEASVLSEQGSQLPAPARRPVELLIADVRRLRTLVDELMEISRLDAGSEPVRRHEVDVGSIAVALISARDWQDRVAVSGGTLTLPTDPRRVERILSNLIGNAIEHSGSDVGVRTGTEGDTGWVEVSDGGPGIPAEHLPHVFERFYKADSARTSAGSGLGLAIALENARLLGGTIGVASDVRRGSVFRLTLPLRPGGTVTPGGQVSSVSER